MLCTSLEKTEANHPNIRPLPPLDEEESRAYIDGILDLAGERALTTDECFLMGQLMAAYCMAIEARMLGRKGRYYMISEADMEALKKRRRI
jgi:hypothetical protein